MVNFRFASLPYLSARRPPFVHTGGLGAQDLSLVKRGALAEAEKLEIAAYEWVICPTILFVFAHPQLLRDKLLKSRTKYFSPISRPVYGSIFVDD